MKVLAKILSNIDDFSTDNGAFPKLQVFDKVDNLAQYNFPMKNTNVVSVVCISGSAHFVSDMRKVDMGPHTIAVILPGHLIEEYSTSDDFHGFMIASSERNFAAFLPMMSRLFMCSMYFRDNPMVSLTTEELDNQVYFHRLLKNKLKDCHSSFDRMVVNKLIEGIFCETLNIFFKRLDISLTTYCNRSESLFYRFIVDIENYYKRERSVSFYADKLCVSAKHLSSVVKEISGRTASDWIDSYVVNEIKRLLATTDMTIQEISCKLNFANQSFFGKYFKVHVGMSPREYRNSQFR